IVRGAQGSLRDALSLLDTAIAYGNGRLDAATTAGLLGTTAPEAVRAFAAALVAHESTPALEAIDRAARDGEDLQAFTRDVIELLRRALVLKAAPTAKLADVSHAEGNELRRLGESASLDDLLYVLRAFLDADAAMRESPHPRVELEIAAVRATRRPVPQALEDILRRVDEAEQRLRQQGSGVSAPSPRQQESLLAPEVGARPVSRSEPPLDRPGPIKSQRPASPPPTGSSSSGGASPSVPVAAPPSPAVTPSGDTAAGWQRVVDEVMGKKPTLGAVLAQTRPGAIQDRELTVILTGNHFHREMLADTANRDVVAQAVRRHVAGAERFKVTAESEGSGGSGVMDHPAVQAAIEAFQGEVVAVRPRLPEGEGQ
ncbi:MAG TPA: hypothetical protein VGU22_06075, partial [Methylomirabilota bacterium]|nr:hypothetical protein [Methylomirabilota bacterium]